MIFDRQKLLIALKQCSAGVNNNMAGSDTFTFYRGKVFTYNDELAVSKKIEFCNEDTDMLKFSVSASDFLKIIEKFKSDEIKVDILESSLKMACGRSKVEIPFVDYDFEKRFELFENIDDWQDADENIVNGIVMCRIVGNRSALNGVFVSGKSVYSTDGYRINRFKLDKEMNDFYLSEKTCNEIVKFNNFKKIKVGKWLHLKDEDDTIFSVRLLEIGDYPKDQIDNVFSNIDAISKSYFFPLELSDVIDRAAVFGYDIESRNVICLTLFQNKIEVSAERATGKFSEEIELNYSFDFEQPLKILMDEDMLKYAIKNNMQFSVIPEEPPQIYLRTEYSEHVMSTFED